MGAFHGQNRIFGQRCFQCCGTTALSANDVATEKPVPGTAGSVLGFGDSMGKHEDGQWTQ
jgi:hypothetical protein